MSCGSVLQGEALGPPEHFLAAPHPKDSRLGLECREALRQEEVRGVCWEGGAMKAIDMIQEIDPRLDYRDGGS